MGYVYWLATLFAQNNGNGGGEGAGNGNGQQRPPGDMCTGGGGFVMMLPLIAIGLLFYFMMIRPQQREQRRRQELLSRVKKNDRIITIGGIKGVVTNVQDDEVTIRVDDSNNTKLRMRRSSIHEVLGEEGSEE